MWAILKQQSPNDVHQIKECPTDASTNALAEDASSVEAVKALSTIGRTIDRRRKKGRREEGTDGAADRGGSIPIYSDPLIFAFCNEGYVLGSLEI